MSTETSARNDPAPRVLIAVPRGAMRDRLLALLRERAVDVESVTSPGQIRRGLDGVEADLVVVRREDLTPEDHRRLDAMAEAGTAPDVVVVGPDLDEASKVDLVATGAADVIDAAELDVRAADSIEVLASGPRGHAAPEGPRPALSDFASRSKAMHALLELVQRVAATDSTLLITGETGVGKEHLARAIHADSPRRRGPFLALNCGALPEQLLESELFGHAAGAFTGAQRKRKGLFQAADGGTLLLDEIGEMPLHLQVRLLRVLQRGDVRPLGTDEDVRVDVRVMASTNKDLRESVAEGTFREDLYFRLNVVELHVPPLRDRIEDLPTMIGSILRHFRARTGAGKVDGDVRGVDPAALDALLAYTWPGNVRELIHVLERALLVRRGALIGVKDLPAQVLTPPAAGAGGEPLGGHLPEAWLAMPWKEVRKQVLDAAEKAYLVAALERCQGIVGATAEHAGLSPRSLYDKMKAHGLRKEDFRN